jgi:hypothetical protein
VTAEALRPLTGLTPAEARVIAAATRIVDGDASRYPFLTAAVNALHHERSAVITNAAFHAQMLLLAPTTRASDALRRAKVHARQILFEFSAADVQDIRNSGWHCWAIWYLTCEQFGVEPPWGAELRNDGRFKEQLEFERNRIKEAEWAAAAAH